MVVQERRIKYYRNGMDMFLSRKSVTEEVRLLLIIFLSFVSLIIEVIFTYHKIHHFEVYNSLVF